MIAAFLMMVVTIFGLPMSSTQIVFSGLSAVSLKYFTGQDEVIINWQWLTAEFLIWIISPPMGILIAVLLKKLIQDKVINSPNARAQVLKMIPF
jgi:phosphate/sulfate permease